MFVCWVFFVCLFSFSSSGQVLTLQPSQRYIEFMSLVGHHFLLPQVSGITCLNHHIWLVYTYFVKFIPTFCSFLCYQ